MSPNSLELMEVREESSRYGNVDVVTMAQRMQFQNVKIREFLSTVEHPPTDEKSIHLGFNSLAIPLRLCERECPHFRQAPANAKLPNGFNRPRMSSLLVPRLTIKFQSDERINVKFSVIVHETRSTSQPGCIRISYGLTT